MRFGDPSFEPKPFARVTPEPGNLDHFRSDLV